MRATNANENAMKTTRTDVGWLTSKGRNGRRHIEALAVEQVKRDGIARKVGVHIG
jgi:hypothetical protein